MYSVAKGSTPCSYASTSHPTATLVFTTSATSSVAPATSAFLTTTPDPDGKSTLSNKSCHVDSTPDGPTMPPDKAINAIKKLCKKELKGDRNPCIQQSMPIAGGLSI